MTTTNPRLTPLRAAGAALLAAGLACGVATPALAVPDANAAAADPAPYWETIPENRGAVLSATISDDSLARLEAAGVRVEGITIDGDYVDIAWSIIEDTPFPEGLTPMAAPGREWVDLEANPWGGHDLSMMLGVRGQNVYEPGNYPAGSPAGTFTSQVPMGFSFNGYVNGSIRFQAASLSSWRPGSEQRVTAVESWNIDSYQTLDPARETAAEAMGVRGHYLPNLSQCYDNAACGIYIQPAAFGMLETPYGSTSGMLTLTDPIWVSVHTTAGIKTPSNYVDTSGSLHTFTIDDSEASFASSSQLQNPWNLPTGIDDSGRVQPRLDLLTPFYRVDQGTIGLGVDASVGVTQTWEPYGVGHRLTVTPSIPLDGRAWQIDTAATNGVFVVQHDGIEYRVDVTTAVVGEQVVIDVVVTGDGINPVPAVDPTAPFLTMYAGGLAMHEAFWRTPAYVETITAAPEPPVEEPPVVEPPVVEPPVVVPPTAEPPAVTPPVEVPVAPEVPVVEDPVTPEVPAEEPVEVPVFNTPFRPETDVVTAPAGQHGMALGFAAAALLASTGSALLLRARRAQD